MERKMRMGRREVGVGDFGPQTTKILGVIFLKFPHKVYKFLKVSCESVLVITVLRPGLINNRVESEKDQKGLMENKSILL